MISRDELYDLVWKEPMSTLADRFKVSGSYLARICTLLNVPRPERGYWAKLAVKKAPARRPLPDALPGDPLHWSKEGEPIRVQKAKAPERRVPEAKPVRISRTSIHGLIRGAKFHFDNGRPVEEGALLRPLKKLLTDVTCSKPTLDKALDLANDLFNAFESVGHRVVLAPANTGLGRYRIDERETASKPRDHWEHSGLWSPSRPTVVYVGSVALGLAIIEMTESVMMRYLNGRYVRDADNIHPRRGYADHSWTTRKDVPSGRLRLVAYAASHQATWHAQWDEVKGSSLRSRLRSIVEVVEAAAPVVVEQIKEAARKAELQRKQWAIEDERRRREDDHKLTAKSIIDAKEELGSVIEAWERVLSVERFLNEVEERAGALPASEREEVLERLGLAREFMGAQDPLDFLRAWQTPAERYSPRYAGSHSAEGQASRAL